MKPLLRQLLRFVPDEVYIQLQYFYHFHCFANLNNPQTFSEKLQWLKLHDRNPLYPTLVDKYAVKKWVAGKIGSAYVVPTLGVWKQAENIDFDTLPSQFVLKCNHDSGSIVICRDKNRLNEQEAVAKLARALRTSGYAYGREWPYQKVEPCIIAEPLLTQPTHTDLTDYKFFCFNGLPRYCQVITERSSQEKVDFFDMNWKHQPFTGLHLPGKPFPSACQTIHRPVNFSQMQNFCRKLAQDLPFVRVDFYEVNEQVYFGELTFFPAGGFGEFTPAVWNKTFGDGVLLPGKK